MDCLHCIEFLSDNIFYACRKFVRTFKTDRSIAAELRRNPSVASRLRTAFSGNPQKLDSELSNSSETLKRLLEKTTEGGVEKSQVRLYYCLRKYN